MMQYEVQISMYKTFLTKIKPRSEHVSGSNDLFIGNRGQKNPLNKTKEIQLAKSRM